MRIAFWFKEPSLRHTSWFRLASASTVKDDCTSYQRRPRWMPNLCWYFASETGCALQDSSSSCLHFPTGQCTCMHCTCGTRLDRHQLHRFHRQWWVATELSWVLTWIPDYYVWRDNARVLPYVSSEAEKHWRAEGCPAFNLGWVATELNQQGSARVSPRDCEHVLKLVLDIVTTRSTCQQMQQYLKSTM